MAEGLENCSFGVMLNSTCHLQHYVKRSSLLQLKNLTQDEQNMLLIRTSTSCLNPDEATICLHHKAVFLTHFKSLQRNKCCNPFELHKKKRGRGKLIFTTFNLASYQALFCVMEAKEPNTSCVICMYVIDSIALCS